jgi:hypothetical protein
MRWSVSAAMRSGSAETDPVLRLTQTSCRFMGSGFTRALREAEPHKPALVCAQTAAPPRTAMHAAQGRHKVRGTSMLMLCVAPVCCRTQSDGEDTV